MTITSTGAWCKVFGDPDGLKKLTDIVWPEIRRLEMEIEVWESSILMVWSY